MDDVRYWIWLSLCFKYGSDKPSEIMMHFDSPKDFYSLCAEEMLSYPFLNENDVRNLKSTRLERADLIIKACQKHSIDIVTYTDDDYPKRLSLIYGAPVVLYKKGDISGLDDHVVITIVGTRKPIEYTAYATEYLAYGLARAGAVVVSGFAVGVDSAAHRGALKAKGRTIAVMACGIDIDYPFENKNMKQEILENGGALISELPPGEKTSPQVFAFRNRILSGLSLGVVVTHAPERSGSLITAEHAVEQGRDIFCLPPFSIFDSEFSGVVKYLRDGAIPIFGLQDILLEYYGAYAHNLNADKLLGDYVSKKRINGKDERVKSAREQTAKVGAAPEQENEEDLLIRIREKFKAMVDSFDETELLVYNSLDLTPQHIDEIAQKCRLRVGDLLSILTELELMDIVESSSGRRYSLNKISL